MLAAAMASISIIAKPGAVAADGCNAWRTAKGSGAGGRLAAVKRFGRTWMPG